MPSTRRCDATRRAGDSVSSTAPRNSSCRNDTPSPAGTSTPASTHVSTSSGAPATTAASARVGITDTSLASSLAGLGSDRSRSRIRSCTVAGTVAPSLPSSSVTSNGLPPVSR
ncbi:hypothetical protein [Nonomuraea solani]|uniref:hypothetical protein n=1 Tax=Nonomuraea solani TaxID=1144553 RepID=UPI0011B04E70|nr:hypothetical protein [Nonomuraea solani]